MVVGISEDVVGSNPYRAFPFLRYKAGNNMRRWAEPKSLEGYAPDCEMAVNGRRGRRLGITGRTHSKSGTSYSAL